MQIQANTAPGFEMVSLGGGGWIRTNVGARPTDLQSAPFNHSGTPPERNEIMNTFIIGVKPGQAARRNPVSAGDQ